MPLAFTVGQSSSVSFKCTGSRSSRVHGKGAAAKQTALSMATPAALEEQIQAHTVNYAASKSPIKNDVLQLAACWVCRLCLMPCFISSSSAVPEAQLQDSDAYVCCCRNLALVC